MYIFMLFKDKYKNVKHGIFQEQETLLATVRTL